MHREPGRVVGRWAPRRRAPFGLLLGAAALALGTPAPARGQDLKASGIPDRMTVHLETPRAPEVFARVVHRLGEMGLLDFVPIIDRSGVSPAELLSKEGRILGPSVAPELDAYLCAQNAHACSLLGGGDGGRTSWGNQKAPPGVELTTERCPASTLPRYVLCVPDIRVDSYVTLTKVDYDTARQSLPDVVRRLGACDSFDKTCWSLVESSNPEIDLRAARYKGPINVPVRAFRIEVPVGSQLRLRQITAALDGLSVEARGQGLLAEQDKLYYTVRAAARKFDAVDPTTLQADPGGDYVQALQRMGFPFAQIFGGTPRLPRMHVAVWDRHVDDHHCDFTNGPSNAIELNQELAVDGEDPGPPGAFPDCTQVVPNKRSDKWDHATHVAGILGARINAVGIIGVNPWVRIWAYEIRGDRLDRDGDPIIALRLNDATSGVVPTIVNMSFSEDSPSYQTNLERLIARHQDSVLFVAAAGKGTGDIESPGECLVSPACLSTNPARSLNLISVVALDGGGAAPLTSSEPSEAPNFGPVFDVAAIGDVVAPFHGNAFGRMTGSSVAAPYVSGLASLLEAVQLLQSPAPFVPWLVKQRILYTADFTRPLDAIVHYGRINFTRALATSQEQWVLKPSSGAQTLSFRVPCNKVHQSNLAVESALRDGQDLTPVTISSRTLRRLVAMDDDPASRYWAVYTDPNNPKTLIRLSEVQLVAGAQIIVRRDDGTETSIDVQNVKDFTACAATR